MTGTESWPLSREMLLEYFLQAAKPREQWQVGMELEKMGRAAADGKPIRYEGDGPTVRKVLELIRLHRGGDPVLEGDHLIGLDGPWGTISLEPGGQVEWSSRPQSELDELGSELASHLAVMRRAETDLGLKWLEEAVDPSLALGEMVWMPKARYHIMRPYLGARGRLAHRMMTQTASIQCAFDYADPSDWLRKFRAATVMAPIAVALFANSERIDGEQTDYRCYREAIWRETDPDRCGLPTRVFDADFGLEAWLDWILQVPTIFRHRARGLVPAGGVPFSSLMERAMCDAPRAEDWETHISTIFTEVRSYTYLEVRSADLQPDALAMAVPTFWTGILYEEQALDAALELGSGLSTHAAWSEGMEIASRLGLEGVVAGRKMTELAVEALGISMRAIRGGAACVRDRAGVARWLESLADHHDLDVR